MNSPRFDESSFEPIESGNGFDESSFEPIHKGQKKSSKKEKTIEPFRNNIGSGLAGNLGIGAKKAQEVTTGVVQDLAAGGLSGVKGLLQGLPGNVFSMWLDKVLPENKNPVANLNRPINEAINKFDPYKTVGTENKPFDTPGGTLQLAGEFAIPGAYAGKVVKSGINALKPSNFLRGNVSSQELKNSLEATAGTKTGLGDVIQNPLMKKFYDNVLTHLPFSGANKQMAEVATDITNRGQNIVDRFSNGMKYEQIPTKINASLQKASKDQEKLKRDLYKEPQNIAKDIDLKLDLPNFSKVAKKHIKSIEDQNFLQHEPEARSLLNRLRNYQNPTEKIESVIVNKEGKPLVSRIKYPSLKEANILAGKLGNLSSKYRASSNPSDHAKAGVLGELAKTLKNDIKSSIQKSDNKELKRSFNRAEDNYKLNYSPFLDKQVRKYTKGGEDPEKMLQTFLIGGKNDRSNQLNKLMSKLDSESQDLIRYSYFSKAMEGPEHSRTVNPNALSNLWKKLGPKQKKIMIPNSLQRRELDNYVTLVGKNSEPLSLMYNPKTGARGLWGLMTQAPLGFVSRPLVRKLGSEEYRNKLVNKMIKNDNK